MIKTIERIITPDFLMYHQLKGNIDISGHISITKTKATYGVITRDLGYGLETTGCYIYKNGYMYKIDYYTSHPLEFCTLLANNTFIKSLKLKPTIFNMNIYSIWDRIGRVGISLLKTNINQHNF